MKIFSGNYCFCDTGIPTGEKDIHGKELFTGDIVQLWHGNYISTDMEEWMPCDGLTVIVAEGHEGGRIEKPLDNVGKPFTMGISKIGIQSKEWKVTLVKSHEMLVPGERILAWGFNFRDIK